ncbi:MAG TPA: putative peptidoglycan glycosyltransferase FtsW [Tepidisphaeraceae bacterium]|nr:putative peptidoglycan glycosyltransferase FtsW [Tepidisphaeraceae bacterium]
MDVSIYRLRQRDILTVCVLGLLCLGVVMVQSAAMNVTGSVGWSWTERGTRHAAYALVAIAAYFIVGHIDYARLVRAKGRIWQQPIVWMLAATGLTCLIVLVPGIGLEVNGARRWLPLGFVQVQPSELAKWAVVLFLAWWLTEQPVDLDQFWGGFCFTLIPIGLLCLLIVIQDFGTAALIGLCAVTMLVVGRIKWWHLAVVIPPAVAAAGWFVMHKEYRWRRMTAFLDPWAAPRAEGYHMIQSLLSFSTGGFTGRGLGNGIQKLGYLPEDTTDFIFAVICEELGFFGALLTVALYLGILFVAWQAIGHKRDSFGRMLAFGIAAMIGLQAAINIAVATVSVPTKGLSLPLVSAGGSGLVITCAALGLLYSICRHPHEQEPAKTFDHEPDMEPISTSSLIVDSIWRDLAVKH